jgi:hypothetical protein
VERLPWRAAENMVSAVRVVGTLLCIVSSAVGQDAGAPGPAAVVAPEDTASTVVPPAAAGVSLAPEPSLEPGSELEAEPLPDADLAEVTVQATRGAAQQMQQSADAVTVVERRRRRSRRPTSARCWRARRS